MIRSHSEARRHGTAPMRALPYARIGDRLPAGNPLFTLHTGHTGSPSELAYTLDYPKANPEIVVLENR